MVNILELPVTLTILILFSLATTVYTKSKEKRNLFIIFKPLTTVLIILLAFTFADLENKFDLFIIIALLFSLAGDAFLLKNGKLFLVGICSFLIAHINYILAFTQNGFSLNLPLIIVLSLISLSFFLLIKNNLKKYSIPVSAYLAVITCMLYFSIVFFNTSGNVKGNLILIAASLFVISDLLLAINRFHFSFKYAQPLIYLSYFPAQLLFAFSLEH